MALIRILGKYVLKSLFYVNKTSLIPKKVLLLTKVNFRFFSIFLFISWIYNVVNMSCKNSTI